ncbi:hypothetical protein F441_10678 [Phytophthora nicotianae CJ01A1]|uniref:Transmembrane protein n=2 Tax=Phytophthora nicotianae TaxID=4792 RepID=W2IUZ3_PHYNI|nr:hypothetical protein L915_10493 [Phytophthora nicotianae]ETL37989.1 hypothetical protein L916_10386 [Phytophthora nicotianae]ETP14375.1 hypothetical protein F441_10678 [Phytophthora nicotianae CJ01A1]
MLKTLRRRLKFGSGFAGLYVFLTLWTSCKHGLPLIKGPQPNDERTKTGHGLPPFRCGDLALRTESVRRTVERVRPSNFKVLSSRNLAIDCAQPSPTQNCKTSVCVCVCAMPYHAGLLQLLLLLLMGYAYLRKELRRLRRALHASTRSCREINSERMVEISEWCMVFVAAMTSTPWSLTSKTLRSVKSSRVQNLLHTQNLQPI